MKKAVFKSYKNGYYTFLFENGEDMVFDEIHPRALKQFDLKNDTSLIDREFRVSFIEVFEDDGEVIYRIESLKPL